MQHQVWFRSLSFIFMLLAGVTANGQSLVEKAASNSAEKLSMVVYKSASCGCCGDWVKHMQDNGFVVEVHDTENINEIKQRAGLHRNLASCHTAFIEGYVVEGHVPAMDVKRLLQDKPQIKGLTVPGMPAGENVPGMEVQPGNASFDVLSFQEDGTSSVWQHYE